MAVPSGGRSPLYSSTSGKNKAAHNCGYAFHFLYRNDYWGVYLDSSTACWQWKQHPYINSVFSPASVGLLWRGGRLTFYSVEESITQIAAPLPYEGPLCCLPQITLRSWQRWVMPRKGISPPHTFSSNCTLRKQAELPSLRADSQISFHISYPLLSLLEGFTILKTRFFFISLPLFEKHEGKVSKYLVLLTNQSESERAF